MIAPAALRYIVLFLICILLFMLHGCRGRNFQNTPVPMSVISSQQYLSYNPPEGVKTNLRFDIKFDFPTNWLLNESWRDNRISISLGDPRFRTQPTLPPEEIHPVSTDFGRINIWVTLQGMNQSVDSEIETLKQNYSQIDRMVILSDYSLVIDGYVAGVLEYQIKPSENYPSLMFNRRIFFVVNNQLYQIYFAVAEKERGGEFEQGYEYFFKSIRITP